MFISASSSEEPSDTSNHLLDDTTIIQPSNVSSISCLSEEYASTLNKDHQRTPSVSSSESRSSAGSRKRKGKRLVNHYTVHPVHVFIRSFMYIHVEVL